MTGTLMAAVGSLVAWAALLVAGPANGWIHLPLAVGTTLLVRWIALRSP
ncbi:MAG: hypothetical protein ACREOF_12655 [Gemmatimonadales bacterium]